MANTEYPIQKVVEECADELKSQFEQSKAAFVSIHFLCGIPDSPGYIRRSAVRAVNCKLAELADHKHDEGKQNRLHGRAMLEHVRAFDRKHTLFNLVARLSKAKEKDAFLRFNITENQLASPLQINEQSENGSASVTIMLSSQLARVLAPRSDSICYLEAAYKRPDNPFYNQADYLDEFSHRFTRARAEAFGRLLAAGIANGLLKPMTGSVDGNCDEERLWNLLNPVQSMLVYTQSVSEVAGVFEIACFRKETSVDTDKVGLSADSQPLILVFASLFDRKKVEEATDAHFGKRELKEDIAKYLQRHDESYPITLKDELGKQGSYSASQLAILASEVEKSIEPIVCLPRQQKRLAALTWWLCLLAQKLYGRIHEGEPLDFWFVAGERTEFADDATFRLDKLLKDTESLRVPFQLAGSIDEARLKAVVRYLEKEHFPWFHRGRNALFFDISNEEFRPVGLVEVANSSWHQVLDESYKPAGEQYLRLPGCVVVYVNGETHDAGLIRVNPLAQQGMQRIRHLMRLHKGQWQVIGSDERREKLLEQVGHAMTDDDQNSKEITEICLRVADDLSIGGTLVFVDGEAHADGFLKLGESWTFGESLQDRIPLIAHDGATLLFPKQNGGVTKWDWRYRHLLTPDETFAQLQGQLQKWSLDYVKGSPLNGVGTRRWSAALTALRTGVRLVVVISQDGCITCWRCTRNNDKPKTLHFLSLPLTGDVEIGECIFNDAH